MRPDARVTSVLQYRIIGPGPVGGHTGIPYKLEYQFGDCVKEMN